MEVDAVLAVVEEETLVEAEENEAEDASMLRLILGLAANASGLPGGGPPFIPPFKQAGISH